jgi:hypothetical protein
MFLRYIIELIKSYLPDQTENYNKKNLLELSMKDYKYCKYRI